MKKIKLVEIKELDEQSYITYISAWKDRNESLCPSSCDMAALNFSIKAPGHFLNIPEFDSCKKHKQLEIP